MARLRRKKPNAPDPTLSDAYKAYSAGDPLNALRIIGENPKGPERVRLFALRALCQEQLGAFNEALESVDMALRIDQSAPFLHATRAQALRMLGRTEDALAAFDHALALNPKDETAAAGKAQLLAALSRHDEAEELIEPFLVGGFTDHLIALAGARLRKRRGDHDGAIELLRDTLEAPTTSPGAHPDLLFQLGDLFDAAARYEEAFDAFTRANRLNPRGYDAEAHEAAVERMCRAFTREAFDAIEPRDDKTDTITPIFIVGVPRSGTTLIERMLSAHPEVLAAGEVGMLGKAVADLQQGGAYKVRTILQNPRALTPSALESIASRYLAELPPKPPGSSARYVTDKLPGNAYYPALIARLFPSSPIIVADRDARDAALSCLSRKFESRIDWANDPDHLLRYFRDTARVLKHSEEVLGLSITRVRYADLVERTDHAVRTLLDSLGLGWHDACVRPHENLADARTHSADQVTRPIYTSAVARWKNYEPLLAQWFDELASIRF